MQIEFAVAAWAAHAPGLVTPAQWKHWAARPWPIAASVDSASAAVKEMPAMLRRRLGPLGRMAAQVAYDCQQSSIGMPVIFASRYGDSHRSLDLLADYSRKEFVSPADFALSVHNAIGAIFSIARQDTAHYSSVAGGQASAAAGLVEAVALLDEGASEVLLVHYDEPLPGDYARFGDEPAAAYAWAWLLQPAGPNRDVIRLESGPRTTDADEEPASCFGLDALRFLLADDLPSLVRPVGDRQWTWRRHA